MTLADKAEGRMIHITLDFTLIPPKTEVLGHTDAAWDIGEQISAASAEALKAIAIAAGFTAEVETRQVVY